MDYTVKLSLEHITLVNITTTLWNQLSIQDEIKASISFTGDDIIEFENWQNIESMVLEKVNGLSLPNPLKNKIKHFVKPIGLEIVKLCKRISPRTEKQTETCLNNLCWTPRGRIDEKEVVKCCLICHNYNIFWRFELACRYFCEEYIDFLWLELPKSHREYFSNGEHRNLGENYKYLAASICYVGDLIPNLILLKREDCDNSSCEYLTEWSIIENEEVAFHYFWKKLTAESKNGNVVRFLKTLMYWEVDSPEILSFLLSQMNLNQQMEVLRDQAFAILECLLKDWSRQDSFFLPTVKLVWDFLIGDEYFVLLLMIAWNINNHDWEGDKYQQMFLDLWDESPQHLKQSVISNCWDLLAELFEHDSIESMAAILKDSSEEDRNLLIHCEKGFSVCKRFLDKKKELFEDFIKLALSSQEEIRDFKLKLGYDLQEIT